MRKNILRSFSINTPNTWVKFTADEYRFVLTLFALGFTVERICLTLTIRRIPKDVRDNLDKMAIAAAAESFRFIETPPKDPRRRLLHIINDNYKAFHPLLGDLPFGNYLMLENIYEGFLLKKDLKLLDEAAVILYHDLTEASVKAITDGERLSILHWLNALKVQYAKDFPFLFKRQPGGGKKTDMRERMTAQIRALTGGDVTKEEAVLKVGTYAALTELNAKAREMEELKQATK